MFNRYLGIVMDKKRIESEEEAKVVTKIKNLE